MPYVQVPKDLTKVKTKVALNLTKRQLICFGIAIVTAVPVFLLTKGKIGTANAMLLLVAVAFPTVFIGMYEKDGQPIEKIFKNFWKWSKRPKKRPYRTNNLYSALSIRMKGDSPTGKSIDKNNKKTSIAKKRKK